MVLTEAMKMKPGRDVGPFLDKLFTEVLGTAG